MYFISNRHLCDCKRGIIYLSKTISFRKGEFEDWADDMARKGLFQSVPPEAITDTGANKK